MLQIFIQYSMLSNFNPFNFNCFQILLILILEEFENLSVEKKTLSTALGFEPRSFDCRLFFISILQILLRFENPYYIIFEF